MFPNEHDKKNIAKLQASKVKSRRVVGRGTLVVDASEIRGTGSFQEALKRGSGLVKKEGNDE